ncbi:helix-turn-helix domain-containing protein [Actinokineospora sp. G85]|uniref:helix-turn-helix domain-containing protein n=1 Tax=Actinokineospora sp. G85 TaxID=3406626 RepID=UPI003C76575B
MSMIADGLEQRTLLPPGHGTVLRDKIQDLLAHLPRDRAARLIGPDGTETDLPDEVYRTLREVLDALLKGKAITLAPHNTMLTTQQAADLLGISRPTLVKLLESGAIPYEQPGRHRRVRLVDLVTYREKSRTTRRQDLRALTRDADEDGLYDSGTGFIDTR